MIRQALAKLGFYRNWKAIERFDPAWLERIRLMARLIPEDSASVVDVGCGPMWLRDLLPSGVAYVGIDYKARGEGSMVCDLNVEGLPKIVADTYFISGCLEYVKDPRALIGSVASCTTRCCIASYCCTEEFPDSDFRRTRGWINHLSRDELIGLFMDAGMKPLHAELTSTNNAIFVFDSRSE